MCPVLRWLELREPWFSDASKHQSRQPALRSCTAVPSTDDGGDRCSGSGRGGLLGYIVYQRVHSRTILRQLAEVQRQIDGLDREEAQARAILNKPANREVADQSDFLNELFARKALSWTRIFTEMERIVPPELHVVSMKPEYTKT